MIKPVLVVEDELDIRENLVMLLEDEGYTVYAAADGQEALEVLRDGSREPPGLVVLDFYMPVMDARAFLEALEIEKHARPLGALAIVLVTAADPHARAGIEEKTVAVLRKPIDIEAFLEIVRKYCR